MTPQPEKLQVASPRQRNAQLSRPDRATTGATSPQPAGLKALARKALACNNSRNRDATGAPETMQLSAPKAAATVARTLHPKTPALRSRLLVLADAYGHDRAPVRALPEAELSAWCAWFDTLPPERHAEALRVWLDTLQADADRRAGRVPAGETAAILCRSCGPVYAPPSVAAVLPVVGCWPRALGCPWCFIRAAGGYVPRPPVMADACMHRMPDRVNPTAGRGVCKCGSWYPGQRHACQDFQPRDPPPTLARS